MRISQVKRKIYINCITNFPCMKKLFVLLLLVVFGFSTPAQEGIYEVVQLRHDTNQQDLFVVQFPEDSIEPETDILNLYTGKISETGIDTSEHPENEAGQTTEANAGFKGVVTLGYQLGVGDYGLNRLKLNLSGGYLVDPQILLGAGIGARQYPDIKATLLPIYAEFRGWLLTSRVSPFFSFQVGTMFHVSKEFENVGIFVSPNLGVSSRFSDGTSMNFSLGYEYQRMGFYRDRKSVV